MGKAKNMTTTSPPASSRTTLKTTDLSAATRHRLRQLELDNVNKLRRALAQTVRDSQGRKKASYLSRDRPEWWDLNVDVDFGYGEITSLPQFQSSGWNKMNMMAALTLYYYKELDSDGDGALSDGLCNSDKKKRGKKEMGKTRVKKEKVHVEEERVVEDRFEIDDSDEGADDDEEDEDYNPQMEEHNSLVKQEEEHRFARSIVTSSKEDQTLINAPRSQVPMATTGKQENIEVVIVKPEESLLEMNESPERLLRKRRRKLKNIEKSRKQLKRSYEDDESTTAALRPIDPNIIRSPIEERVNKNEKEKKMDLNASGKENEGADRKHANLPKKAKTDGRKRAKKIKPAKKAVKALDRGTKTRTDHNLKESHKPAAAVSNKEKEVRASEKMGRSPSKSDRRTIKGIGSMTSDAANKPKVVKQPKETQLPNRIRSALQDPSFDGQRMTEVPVLTSRKGKECRGTEGSRALSTELVDMKEKRKQYALSLLEESKRDEEAKFKRFVKQKRKEIDEYIDNLNQTLATALLAVPDDVRSMLMFHFYERNFNNISTYIQHDIERRVRRLYGPNFRRVNNLPAEDASPSSKSRAALLEPMPPPKSAHARRIRTNAAEATKRAITERKPEFKSPSKIVPTRRRPMRQSAIESLRKIRSMSTSKVRQNPQKANTIAKQSASRMRSARGTTSHLSKPHVSYTPRGRVPVFNAPKTLVAQTPVGSISVLRYGKFVSQTPETMITSTPTGCASVISKNGSPLEIPSPPQISGTQRKAARQMNTEELSDYIKHLQNIVKEQKTTTIKK